MLNRRSNVVNAWKLGEWELIRDSKTLTRTTTKAAGVRITQVRETNALKLEIILEKFCWVLIVEGKTKQTWPI